MAKRRQTKKPLPRKKQISNDLAKEDRPYDLVYDEPPDPFSPWEQTKIDHDRKDTQPAHDLESICECSSIWERWLRVELQVSLETDVDFSSWEARDRLRQLPLPDRNGLSTEQCGVIDIITHLSEIRTAIDVLSKVADEKLGANHARVIKEEVAVLAARLIFRSISLTAAAAEVAFDKVIKKHEHKSKVNRDNASKTRKLTPELETLALTRMDELANSDMPTTKVAEFVADELKRVHNYRGGWKGIYNADQRRNTPNAVIWCFPFLQSAPQIAHKMTSKLSTCQSFSRSPLASALKILVEQRLGRKPRRTGQHTTIKTRRKN
jgi:hypothetical protein